MKDGNLPSAKTVTVAIAVLMVVLAAQAPAATLDPERCRVSQPRIEAQLGRGRERCGPLAEQHAPNDFETTYQACEARAIEAYAARMLRAGCDVDDGEGIEAPSWRQGDLRHGWVTLMGKPMEATYEVIDGLAVLGGDMILGTEADVAAGDREIRARIAAGASPAIEAPTAGGRSLIHNSTANWPNNTIPYKIDTSVSSTMDLRIRTAVTHWNENTIVRVRPHATGEVNFVRFVEIPDQTAPCTSHMGMAGGEQQIRLNLGRCHVGKILHEIGHAVGLFHEQSRPDRDSFVTLHLENVTDPRLSLFWDIIPSGIVSGPFDFNSTMLYSPTNFSSNGQPTMTRLDGSLWTENRTTLSTGDIIGITRKVTGFYYTGIALGKKYRNRGANLCMDGGANGGAVRLADCAGAVAQQWLHYSWPLGRDMRRVLVNKRSGMCLEVPQNSSSSGADLSHAPCHGRKSQLWELKLSNISNYKTIFNMTTRRCVDFEEVVIGGRVEQRSCVKGGPDRQLWSAQQP